ncbi:hypothetical protein [Scytonema sp. UIC 10036]|nr:hypothetical protein [Scytonema sp. UIC 10036]
MTNSPGMTEFMMQSTTAIIISQTHDWDSCYKQLYPEGTTKFTKSLKIYP